MHISLNVDSEIATLGSSVVIFFSRVNVSVSVSVRVSVAASVFVAGKFRFLCARGAADTFVS